jgi:Uma2 family endonuclease
MTPTETAATTKLMTAEEFAEFVQRPENNDKWFELIRGEVIELPPPTKPHCRVTVNISFELETYSRRRRRGCVLSNDCGVILERDPDTVRGPDVALYEDADHFRDLHPKYGEVPPILAVEVLSPSDTFKRVDKKIKEYLRNGVQVVWLADPDERTVSVYRPGGRWETIAAEQQLTGDPELPGFQCRVADLFILPGDLPPDPPAA